MATLFIAIGVASCIFAFAWILTEIEVYAIRTRNTILEYVLVFVMFCLVVTGIYFRIKLGV